MLMNKGFTLVETLFVLFVICILSTLSLTLHMPQKSESMLVQEIIGFLNEAKLTAMTYKQTVTLTFSNSEIVYHSADFNKEYQLYDQSFFEPHEMTFNLSGNIKGAKTVVLHTSKKQYQFVFQVGSGCFYVR
jgi:prepilin-type N-terminal cleavage/methylation domain-containing protein